MITIQPATILDIKTIQELVAIIWPETYGGILTKVQLDYMIDLIYSDAVLTKQIQKQEQLYYIFSDENSELGFFAIEHNYKNEAVTRIHKIYILPETQGRGIGTMIMDKIAVLALENDSKKLSLNVNRFNNALHFYHKIGFQTVGEENIEIGKGYLMEDYMMEKIL
jgi:diamine N-acetyltransferase